MSINPKSVQKKSVIESKKVKLSAKSEIECKKWNWVQTGEIAPTLSSNKQN